MYLSDGCLHGPVAESAGRRSCGCDLYVWAIALLAVKELLMHLSAQKLLIAGRWLLATVLLFTLSTVSTKVMCGMRARMCQEVMTGTTPTDWTGSLYAFVRPTLEQTQRLHPSLASALIARDELAIRQHLSLNAGQMLLLGLSAGFFALAAVVPWRSSARVQTLYIVMTILGAYVALDRSWSLAAFAMAMRTLVGAGLGCASVPITMYVLREMPVFVVPERRVLLSGAAVAVAGLILALSTTLGIWHEELMSWSRRALQRSQGWLTLQLTIPSSTHLGAIYIRDDTVYVWSCEDVTWTLVPEVPLSLVARQPVQGVASAGWGLWIAARPDGSTSTLFARSILAPYFEGVLEANGRGLTLQRLSLVDFSNGKGCVQVQYVGQRFSLRTFSRDLWLQANRPNFDALLSEQPQHP